MKKIRKKAKKLATKCIHAFGIILMLLQTVSVPLATGALFAPAVASAEDAGISPDSSGASSGTTVSDPAPKADEKADTTAKTETKSDPAPATDPKPVLTPPADPTPAPATTDAITSATDNTSVNNGPTAGTGGIIDPEAAFIEKSDKTTGTQPVVTPAIDTAPMAEKTCLADGASIKSSDTTDWDVTGDIAKTKDSVKLGVKYEFPGNKDISVTFTCLPTDLAKLSPLKIEQIKSSDINLPDGVNAATDYAYDVTTSMKDGDFKYDLTLPKSDKANADINYIEKTAAEVKSQDITASDLKSVDNTKVKTETSDVKVSELDHFTIFIATYADFGLTTSEVTYLQGDTVYTNSTSLTSNKYYKVDIIEQNGTTRYPANACTTGVTSLEGSSLLSATAQVGASWKAEITQYNNSSDCASRLNIQDTVTANFAVVAYNTSTANPTISQSCGLDIALVVDISSSIDSTELSQMKTALTGFVSALAGTPTQFSVTKFGTNASVVQTFTSNTTDVNNAINAIPASPANTQGTNWKEGIAAARGTFGGRADKPNLMIFASDGNPTFPDCGGATTCATDVNSAIAEANTAKASPLNIRILALGIGDGLLVENLKAISGHVVNASSILGSDVITTDFSGMASQLASFAKQTCGGTITVNKYYDDTSHRGGTGWTFDVAGSSKTTDSNGQTDAVNVSVGSNYSVTENNMLSGYSYGSASCKKSTGESVGSVITNGVGNIAVGADDIISCNFVNTANPTKGNLKVHKTFTDGHGNSGIAINVSPGGLTQNTDGSGDATFSDLTAGTYSATATEPAGYYESATTCSNISVVAGQTATCTITDSPIKGTIVVHKNISGGSATPSQFCFTLSPDPNIGQKCADNATGNATFSNVPAGTYSASETATASNYAQTGNDCSTLVIGNNGDSRSCTITNTIQTGTLIVNKVLSPSSDAGKFNLQIDGVSKVTNVGDGGSTGSQTLSVGSHTVSETAETGTSLSDYTSVIGGACDSNGNVSLAAGDNKTCTITNTRKTGHIIVDKVTNPSADSTSFSFTTTGSGYNSFNLTDAATPNNQTLNAGIYSVAETAKTGWDQTSATCVSSIGDIETIGSLKLDPNETITCTFTNTKQNPVINVVKSSTTTSVTTAGQVVPYKFVVTNIGNMTLTGITVTDPKCTSAITGPSGDTNTDSKLQTSETWTYTCNHTVTQAEIDGGGNLSNTVTADSTESAPDTDSLNIPISQDASISVEKTSTTTTLSAPATVTYSYVVTNTGNVTLTGISLSDNNDNNDMNCPATTLAVTANMTCTATHTFTQAELDAGGSLDNTVTASSKEAPAATDDLSIPITQSSLMTVEKTSTTTTLSAPATVTYSYVVTNTGNVTLTGISLSDNNDNNDMNCPATTLAVTANMTCTATHTFTQAELDAGGSLDNTVTASSKEAPAATDDLSIPISQNPSLDVTKDADVATVDVAGDLITYTINVQNTGNQTLTGVSVSDPLLGDVDCDGTAGTPFTSTGLTIDVGATLTCIGTYTVTQSDIDNYGGGDGDIDNTATVDSDQTEPDTASETVKINGSITVIKVDNLDSGQDFTFNYTPMGSAASQFILDDDNNSDSTYSDRITYSNLSSTFYNINEVEASGWTPSIVECTSNYPSFTVQNNLWYGTMSVALRPGEKMTCTFANTRDTGTLQVFKNVDLNGDGDYDDPGEIGATDWQWQVAGPVNKNGNTGDTAVTIPTGDYALTETAKSDFHFSNLVCTGGTLVGDKITVAKDSNVICTFSNARDMGTLTVIKHVVGGTDDASDWTMLVRSDPSQNAITPFLGSETGITNNLPTDTYTITELGMEKDLSNYTLTYSGDCDSQGQVTVATGTPKTCTLTNTRDTGSIKVNKLADTDGDGTFETSNPESFTWNADGTGTNAMGATVPNISTGQYSIGENSPSDYHLVTWYITADTTQNCDNSKRALPANITVNKDLISEITICDAIDTGTIIAHKFISDNRDDIQDPGEANKEGWQMSLYAGENCLGQSLYSGLTDVNGDKFFSNLPYGKYSVTEEWRSGWENENNLCQNVTLDSETKTASFGNFEYGKIQGYKYSDANNNGSKDSDEQYLAGWKIRYYNKLSDGSWSANYVERETASDGSYGFDNLSPGTYFVCEALQDSWRQTAPALGENRVADQSPNSSEEGSVCWQADITRSGDAIQNQDFGNVQLSDIHGYKWNDLDGNGIQNGDEPKLSGWEIFIDKNDNSTWDDGELKTTTSSDSDPQHFGWYWFENLLPGTYKICEVQQVGWMQTYPANPSCHTINLPDSNPNDFAVTANMITAPEYKFGNQFVAPQLKIDKYVGSVGNYSLINQHPGDTVHYILKIKATGGDEGEIPNVSDVNNVQVTDLPPAGFVYQPGSETATSSNSSHSGSLGLSHAYASPGVWNLGTMIPGEVIMLSYDAVISADQVAGNYPDLAWAAGTDLMKNTVQATKGDPELFAGTQVAVIVPASNSVALAEHTKTDTTTKHKTRRVLGASTGLPATGSNTFWIILAMLLAFVGGGLIFFGRKKKNQANSSINTVMKIFVLAIGIVSLFGFSGTVQASLPDPNISVKIETPVSPSDTGTFKIGFVALDIKGRNLAAECLKIPSDVIPNDYVAKAGGNSGNCLVSLPDGTYQFYVRAYDPADSSSYSESDTVSVEINSAVPGTPLNYDRPNDGCAINFTTANDGITTGVELYRSTALDFVADDSTRVATASILPNTAGSITDPNADCGGDFFYAIDAVSASGAQSGFVGDEKVTVHHRTRTVTRTVRTGGGTITTGAIPVAGGGAVAGQQTGQGQGQEQEQGNVQGENVEQGQTGGAETGQGNVVGAQNWQSKVKNNWPWIALALVVLGLIYYAARKRKGRKPNLPPPSVD